MQGKKSGREVTKSFSIIEIVFWALIATFILLISMFFIPSVRNLLRGSSYLIIIFAWFLLGAILVCLSFKSRVESRLKKFLILTGVSSTGFFISVVLHNLFYALGIITAQNKPLSFLMEGLHVAFFIIAIFIFIT